MTKIALLFTLLCAGALNGMENPEHDHHIGLEKLSPEIQVMIIQDLNTYDPNLSDKENLITVIKAINAISRTNQQLNAVVNNVYDNQKKFTALVHMLADKSNKNRHSIAYTFKIPASKEYIRLARELFDAITNGNIDKVTQLITQGADVNYNTRAATPLLFTIMGENKNAKMVKLLLDSGANPNFIHSNGTTLEHAQIWDISEEIKKLLEDAMKITK